MASFAAAQTLPSPPPSSAEDPRISDILIPFEKAEEQQIVGDITLIGFPHDEGVRRNGGRVGAKSGPYAFRTYTKRICATDSCLNVDLRNIKIVDGGDVDENLQLEAAHSALTDRVSSFLRQGSVPFVIGGGNDQSYPNVSALLDLAVSQQKSILVINIDAHFDVRPLKKNQVHSGSPFRLMLEDERWTRTASQFIEFASQGAQCSLEHAKYIQSKGGKIYWLDWVTGKAADVFKTILETCDRDYIFVSFDLDAVCGADAPGVSCSSPCGLSAREAVDICRVAGSNRKVKLFDLSEYNPTVDDYRTGRMVAMMFHSFAIARAGQQK